MNETWVTVSGNVSTDVSWRRAATGPVANFRVMSNERKYDGQTGAWRDGDRLAIRVTCWRALAENVQMSITKGDPVVVHGRLYTSEYEQDGVRRSETRIDAKSVGLDLRKVCAKVVLVQEAGDDDGRAPVDVSDLAVVDHEQPVAPHVQLTVLADDVEPDPLGGRLPATEPLAS